MKESWKAEKLRKISLAPSVARAHNLQFLYWRLALLPLSYNCWDILITLTINYRPRPLLHKHKVKISASRDFGLIEVITSLSIIFAPLEKISNCSCPRSRGLVVRAVACEARGPEFNSSSDQMFFLSSGIRM